MTEFKIVVLINSKRHKKTQIGSLMNSEIKTANKRSASQKTSKH